MALSTPIDRHYKFGELYGLRNTYSVMNENINLRNIENKFYNDMMAYIIESGYMEKIERFASKNRVLSNFTQENAINEAFEHTSKTYSSLNIPKIVKTNAKTRAKMAVSNKALSIKTNSYKLPKNDITPPEPTIYEAIDDFKEDESAHIKELINRVASENGILDGSIDKKDKNVNTQVEVPEEVKHNYLIQSIVIEAKAANDKNTILIPPTSIYQYNGENAKTFLNCLFGNVANGINSICGINFTDEDYLWIASGRPYPHLRGEIIVSADMVKGNELLNKYFGPSGAYKDYLFKPDGTPRDKSSKSNNMTDIEQDVNTISSYPIFKVYATVVSWDNINGKDTMRPITVGDFTGTQIQFIN